MLASMFPAQVFGVVAPQPAASEGKPFGGQRIGWMTGQRKIFNQAFPAVLGAAVLLMAIPFSAAAQGERWQRWDTGRAAVNRINTSVGLVIGGEIGRSMDRADRLFIQRALETSRTGQWLSWTNPGSGTEFTVTPTRTFRSPLFGHCRDYQAWVFIGGYEREVTGTACRRPNGKWQAVVS